MKRRTGISCAVLLALLSAAWSAPADTIRLTTGESVSGRVLGVTDGVFHYLEQKGEGIGVHAQIPAASVRSFIVDSPEVRQLRTQIRDLERDNRNQQQQLDQAVQRMGQLMAQIESLEKNAERLRTVVDSLDAARTAEAARPDPVSPISPAGPVPAGTTVPVVIPTFEPTPAQTRSTGRVVIGNLRINRPGGDGRVSITGRMINRGVGDANWVKFRILGFDDAGEQTMNVVRYARRAVLRSGESEDFTFQVSPPYATAHFEVVPEWD